MSENSGKKQLLDAQQLIYLPLSKRTTLVRMVVLLALASFAGAMVSLIYPGHREIFMPALGIFQTAIGGLAAIMFVLFSERQLSTDRLYEKTDLFLSQHIVESFRRIEIPQIDNERTVEVMQLRRSAMIHGNRKDIYGSNYTISLGKFTMRVWVGINVRRLGIIYFVKVDGPEALEKLKSDFQFVIGGAEKVGYHVNFEYACIDNESFVSIWSTVFAEDAILGNPTEQLFWVQDLAMMTQSIARTAVRNNWNLNTKVEPGPL